MSYYAVFRKNHHDIKYFAESIASLEQLGYDYIDLNPDLSTINELFKQIYNNQHLLGSTSFYGGSFIQPKVTPKGKKKKGSKGK